MNCKDCCYNLPKDGYSYCTYEDGECIKISMLEKENAELKSGCGMCYRKDKEQLTKAKEIIKKMLYVSCNSDVLVQYPNCSKVLQSRVEAENFLKESEVNNALS